MQRSICLALQNGCPASSSSTMTNISILGPYNIECDDMLIAAVQVLRMFQASASGLDSRSRKRQASAGFAAAAVLWQQVSNRMSDADSDAGEVQVC